jgi:hypothetical protein
MTNVPFSTYEDSDGWWFISRFGDPAGPYKNQDDALYFLTMHIEQLLDTVRAQLEKTYAR